MFLSSFWTDNIFYGLSNVPTYGALWFTTFLIIYEIVFFTQTHDSQLHSSPKDTLVKGNCLCKKVKFLSDYFCSLFKKNPLFPVFFLAPLVLPLQFVLGSNEVIRTLARTILSFSTFGCILLTAATIFASTFSNGKGTYLALVSRLSSVWILLTLFSAFLSGWLCLCNLTGLAFNLIWNFLLCTAVFSHWNFQPNSEPISSPSNPYLPTESYDLLFGTRKAQADQLVAKLEDSKLSGYSICIGGEWGSGKTSFINGVIEKLNHNCPGDKVIWIRTLEIDSIDELLQYIFNSIRAELKRRRVYVGIASEYQQFIQSAMSALTGKEIGTLLGSKFMFPPSDYRKRLAALDELLCSSMGKDKFLIVVDDIERCSATKLQSFLFIVHEVATLKCCVSIFLADRNQLIENFPGKKDVFLEKFFSYTIEVDDVSPLEIMTAKESELSSSLQIYPTVPMPSETYKRAIESFKDEIAKVENQLKNHSRDKADENFNKSKLTELLNLQQLLEDTFRQPRTVVRFYEYIKQYSQQFQIHCLQSSNCNADKNRNILQNIHFPEILWLISLIEVLIPTDEAELKRKGFLAYLSSCQNEATDSQQLLYKLYQMLITKGPLSPVSYQLKQSAAVLQQVIWCPCKGKQYSLHEYESEIEELMSRLLNPHDQDSLSYDDFQKLVYHVVSKGNSSNDIQQWKEVWRTLLTCAANHDQATEDDSVFPQMFFQRDIQDIWGIKGIWMKDLYEVYCKSPNVHSIPFKVSPDEFQWFISVYCAHQLAVFEPLLWVLIPNGDHDILSSERESFLNAHSTISEMTEDYLQKLLSYGNPLWTDITLTGDFVYDLHNFSEALRLTLDDHKLLHRPDIEEYMCRVNLICEDIEFFEKVCSFFISTTKKNIQPYIPNSSDETTIKGLVEQLESSIMTKDIMYVQKEVKKLNNLLSDQNKVLSEDDAIRLQNTLDKAYFLKKENSEVATEYFISVRSWIARCQNRADISKATPHTS